MFYILRLSNSNNYIKIAKHLFKILVSTFLHFLNELSKVIQDPNFSCDESKLQTAPQHNPKRDNKNNLEIMNGEREVPWRCVTLENVFG